MPRLLNISEAANLAFHVMPLLPPRKSEPISLRNLADRLQVSQAHLSKVLQRLGSAGLVTSSRGPQGGFRLAKPSYDIDLLDIYEAMDGKFISHSCLFDEPVCSRSQCMLHDLIEDSNRLFYNQLSNKLLSDIIESDAANNISS